MTNGINVQPKRRRPWRSSLYLLLGILLTVLLLWSYTWFDEYLEWNRIDKLLAEQDLKHPGWRWHEYLPKPLKQGEVNGALRVIEVGKQITEKMLTADENTEDDVDFPLDTKEYWITLDSPAERNNYRKIHEQCRHCEQLLEKLLKPQPGCLPLNPQRPSVSSLLGGGAKDEPLLAPDEKCYNYVLRWLIVSTRHHRHEAHPKEAIQFWRAWYECSKNWIPGRYCFGLRGQYSLQKELWWILSQTEPDEASLMQLQALLPLWRLSLYTLEDVKMDRTLYVQHILENKDNAIWKENLTQAYTTIPPWIPKSWRDRVKQANLFTPSWPRIIRLEIDTQLKVFDALEARLVNPQTVEELLSPGYDFVEQLIEQLNRKSSDHYKWFGLRKAMREQHENLLLTEALIAAERYRLKQGDYPKQWSDIVPSLLPAIPQSGGKPFLMKQVPEGLAIYQTGFTGKDLGGKVFRTYDPVKNDVIDADIDDGFMLFYPKHRRQPRPVVKPKARVDK